MTLGDLKYIKTGPGICLSWTFLILTAFYAFALLDKLVERLDPVESVVFDENHYTHLDLVDMAGEGSKIAFGVMNQKTKGLLEDPGFEVNLDVFEKLDLRQRVPVPFHKCTDEDFAAFYDIRSNEEES